MKTEYISKRQKKVLYLFFLAGLVVMYAIYIPYLMDYYIIRPEDSLFSFLDVNILNVTYRFEGILIGITIVILYCITLNAGVSTLILSLVLFILTHASYTKYLNRRELLRLDDLRLTEAAGMAVHYIHFELDGYLGLLLCIFIFFTVAGFAMEWLRKSGRKKAEEDIKNMKDASEIKNDERMPLWFKKRLFPGLRFACVALLCVVLAAYTSYFLKSRYVIDVSGPLIPENNMYVLYRFLQNDSLSSISIENVQESYDFLLSEEAPKEMEETVYPNVIVIMNESWWNTDNIDSGNISFSRDPMSAFKALSDRCITGYLTTNVYGGGTVSPEMEFLTGLNTKYYLADSAYAQTLGRKLPSLADYFNGLDYKTVAIHPYYGRFYSRDAVYEAMGFDKVVFEEDMLYKEIYTRYISDESLVRQIIAEAENNSGKPEFIWAVSMANHLRVLDYEAEAAEDYEYPVILELKGKQLNKEDYDTLVNYINGIYLANQAFLQLVEYFSGVEEPTVILMFGDHSPYFSAETLELFGIDETDDSLETLERMYSTPAILWSNFSEGELSFSGESMYYLPQMLIDYAGLPDSDMTRILRYERAYFKTNSTKIVRDAAGKELWQCTMEQIRALSHYKAVQYDILWGEGIGGDVWKPITGDGQ